MILKMPQVKQKNELVLRFRLAKYKILNNISLKHVPSKKMGVVILILSMSSGYVLGRLRLKSISRKYLTFIVDRLRHRVKSKIYSNIGQIINAVGQYHFRNTRNTHIDKEINANRSSVVTKIDKGEGYVSN